MWIPDRESGSRFLIHFQNSNTLLLYWGSFVSDCNMTKLYFHFLLCEKHQSSFLPQRKMTTSAAILGRYCVLFLVLLTVDAQEVPNDSNEVTDVPISTLNITNSDQVYYTSAQWMELVRKCLDIIPVFKIQNVIKYAIFHSFSKFYLKIVIRPFFRWKTSVHMYSYTITNDSNLKFSVHCLRVDSAVPV